MKINHGDLENIQVQRNYNADRLTDIIQFWIDKQPSEVTWHTIITAVDLPPVLEPSIAKCTLDMCLSITILQAGEGKKYIIFYIVFIVMFIQQ